MKNKYFMKAKYIKIYVLQKATKFEQFRTKAPFHVIVYRVLTTIELKENIGMKHVRQNVDKLHLKRKETQSLLCKLFFNFKQVPIFEFFLCLTAFLKI